MNVLITGGTGFIGSRLAEESAARGERVVVLGQVNTPAEEQNAQRLEAAGCQVRLGSVTDPASVRDAVRGIDVVYHLAAAQHESDVGDDHFWKVNVDGTRTMLEACADVGVRRFVHGSTIGVYRAERGTTVDEETPTEPDNIYGVTKLAAERVVSEYLDRVPAVTIRISETYGPGDRRLLKLFRGIARRRYVHIGRSANLHHPVFVDDLTEGLRRAAVSERAVGATIVIPGAEAVTTREMVEAVARSLDAPAPRVTIPLWPLWTAAVIMEKTLNPLGIGPPLHRRRMHFFIKSFRFEGEKARALLDFEPRVGIDAGVSRTCQWYRQRELL